MRRTHDSYAHVALGGFFVLLSFSLGDLYYVLEFADAEDGPFPSMADALYLALYRACDVGLILLLKRRAPSLTSAVWLDGLIGALGFDAARRG